MLDADSIIFDFEDAVPEGAKSAARDLLQKLLKELEWDPERELCVRINKKSPDLYSQEDLDAVKGLDKISSIILPKIENRASKIHEYTGKRLQGLVETAKGLINVAEIAESKGMVALSFGPQDYANSVRGDVSSYSSNQGVIATMVAAARANDLDPVDGVYFELGNLEGFRTASTFARKMGCAGKQVVHPAQIPVANEVFSPTAQEVSEAIRIVEVYEKAGENNTGALRLDDRLIDAVHYRHAKDLLSRVQ